MVKISQRHIKQWLITAPSDLAEQDRIADFLDLHTSQLDDLVSRVNDHRSLLAEYRQALISAAVTGKIDVSREAMA